MTLPLRSSKFAVIQLRELHQKKINHTKKANSLLPAQLPEATRRALGRMEGRRRPGLRVHGGGSGMSAAHTQTGLNYRGTRAQIRWDVSRPRLPSRDYLNTRLILQGKPNAL